MHKGLLQACLGLRPPRGRFRLFPDRRSGAQIGAVANKTRRKIMQKQSLWEDPSRCARTNAKGGTTGCIHYIFCTDIMYGGKCTWYSWLARIILRTMYYPSTSPIGPVALQQQRVRQPGVANRRRGRNSAAKGTARRKAQRSRGVPVSSWSGQVVHVNLSYSAHCIHTSSSRTNQGSQMSLPPQARKEAS